MKIVNNRKAEVSQTFSKLNWGDVFACASSSHGCVYVRIVKKESSVGEDFNALNLSTLEVWNFDDDNLVTKLNASLVIDD